MVSRWTQGFTLIEVMVALILVGVALPALLYQVMVLVDGSRYIKTQTVGHWVVANAAARLELQQRLAGVVLQGHDSGEVEMLDGRWAWAIDSEASGFPGLRRLTIQAGRVEELNRLTESSRQHESDRVSLQVFLSE